MKLGTCSFQPWGLITNYDHVEEKTATNVSNCLFFLLFVFFLFFVVLCCSPFCLNVHHSFHPPPHLPPFSRLFRLLHTRRLQSGDAGVCRRGEVAPEKAQEEAEPGTVCCCRQRRPRRCLSSAVRTSKAGSEEKTDRPSAFFFFFILNFFTQWPSQTHTKAT